MFSRENPFRGIPFGRLKSPQKFRLNCEDKITFYWCLEKKCFRRGENFLLREFRNKAICTYRLKAFSTSFFPLGQVSAINFDSDFFLITNDLNYDFNALISILPKSIFAVEAACELASQPKC